MTERVIEVDYLSTMGLDGGRQVLWSDHFFSERQNPSDTDIKRQTDTEDTQRTCMLNGLHLLTEVRRTIEEKQSTLPSEKQTSRQRAVQAAAETRLQRLQGARMRKQQSAEPERSDLSGPSSTASSETQHAAGSL